MRSNGDAEFQPTAPYHAAFFYPWYPDWSDNGHSPPQNWFSNYLPDPNPAVFDPATELYNSNDDEIIYWQLRKMAEARLEVAISSWWGQGHKTDITIRHILNDVMNRPDNPYPNLRWALYYEKESLGDPSVSELVGDLEYIKANYVEQRCYLKIDGRPVIFVYAVAGDGADMARRWAEARTHSGFYVVLKVFSGYRTDPNQPDSWHQYAPALRIDRQAPYSYMVSPGFWLDGQAVRLSRDLDAFRSAVAEMTAASVPWKFIETWNEWGEGTSVEPGDQVNQTRTGTATLDPNAAPFKNLYVDVLRELLPPLERGTGQHNPKITGASVSGKKLFVFGENFSDGAVVVLDGEAQKSRNDEQTPMTKLVAKKAGKKVEPGQTVTLRVRNSDGTLSDDFTFTLPIE